MRIINIIKQCFNYCILSVLFITTQTYAGSFQGVTHVSGRVVAGACSISMENRYQTIDFLSLTLPELASQEVRESKRQSFVIELRGCGDLRDDYLDKTWRIRFDGDRAESINGFYLHGDSQGMGISLYDVQMRKIIPGQYYPVSNSLTTDVEDGEQIFLRYFINLELTGKSLSAGDYRGLVRFFIDYQ